MDYSPPFPIKTIRMYQFTPTPLTCATCFIVLMIPIFGIHKLCYYALFFIHTTFRVSNNGHYLQHFRSCSIDTLPYSDNEPHTHIKQRNICGRNDVTTLVGRSWLLECGTPGGEVHGDHCTGALNGDLHFICSATGTSEIRSVRKKTKKWGVG